MKQKDYYKILGIEKNAPVEEIKAQYRRLAKKWHPDKNQGNKEAEDRFKEISEAYAVLSDPEKRQQYDRFGSEKFHQRFSQEDIFRGGNVDDMLREMGFGDFFSTFGGGRGGAFSFSFGGGGAPFGAGFGGGQPQDLDTEAELTIPFEDAVNGAHRELEIGAGGKRETVKVKIPAGITDGARLRLAGKGRAARGRHGDLYIKITVAPHPRFRREGDDLHTRAEVPMSTALLGGSAEVPTLEGPRTVKVPAGMQPGQKIRIRGQGVRRGGGVAGDLYVEVAITVPGRMSDEQKAVAEAMRRAGL